MRCFANYLSGVPFEWAGAHAAGGGLLMPNVATGIDDVIGNGAGLRGLNAALAGVPRSPTFTGLRGADVTERHRRSAADMPRLAGRYGVRHATDPLFANTFVRSTALSMRDIPYICGCAQGGAGQQVLSTVVTTSSSAGTTAYTSCARCTCAKQEVVPQKIDVGMPAREQALRAVLTQLDYAEIETFY